MMHLELTASYVAISLLLRLGPKMLWEFIQSSR